MTRNWIGGAPEMDPHAEAIEVFVTLPVEDKPEVVAGPVTGLDIPVGRWSEHRRAARQRRIENVLLWFANGCAFISLAVIIYWWVSGAVGWLS